LQEVFGDEGLKRIVYSRGRDSFEMRTIRGKMTEVIKKSSEELKEHFCVNGVQNQLPDNWTYFKELVVDFCKGQSLNTMTKYKNESWLEFVCRLRDIAMLKN
jgi:hypothetical protein